MGPSAWKIPDLAAAVLTLLMEVRRRRVAFAGGSTSEPGGHATPPGGSSSVPWGHFHGDRLGPVYLLGVSCMVHWKSDL